MRNAFTASMLICFAMMSSCQKQDLTAEQKLAQRTAELDAREKAFEERLNGLEERVNKLDKSVSAERERETRDAEATAPAAQPQVVISDPGQVQSEREAAIEQSSAEIRPPTADPSNMDRMQKRRAPTQRELEDQQSNRPRKLEQMQQWRMSHAAVSPLPDVNSPAPSPAVDATSPTPSLTPP